MSVVASLVMGLDGSTTPSQRITNDIDRRDFLARRRLADCILVGGNTARTESYARTPKPLVVISRSGAFKVTTNPLEELLNLTPREAIAYATKKFGSNISLEVGPDLLLHMLSENLVDELHLTITEKSGAQLLYSPEDFLHGLKIFSDDNIEGTRLIVATLQK